MLDLKHKTILVTGGTGFIGKPLCAALIQQGAEVIVLTRQHPSPSKHCTFISALHDIGHRSVDGVINLAGETIAQRWTPAAQARIRNSRLGTTSSLTHLMTHMPRKPSFFISASAIGYYGTDEEIRFDEHSTPKKNEGFAQHLCFDWEQEARQAELLGIRTVLLRIGVVLEKDGGMMAKVLWPFRLGLGGPLGHGRQWLSWIDRDDLISLMQFIMRTPAFSGPVNATAPFPVSHQVFAETLANCLGKPCLLRTPAFVLRTVLGAMAGEIMLAGQQVIPQRALASGFSFSYPQLHTSLQKILGH